MGPRTTHTAKTSQTGAWMTIHKALSGEPRTVYYDRMTNECRIAVRLANADLGSKETGPSAVAGPHFSPPQTLPDAILQTGAPFPYKSQTISATLKKSALDDAIQPFDGASDLAQREGIRLPMPPLPHEAEQEAPSEGYNINTLDFTDPRVTIEKMSIDMAQFLDKQSSNDGIVPLRRMRAAPDARNDFINPLNFTTKDMNGNGFMTLLIDDPVAVYEEAMDALGAAARQKRAAATEKGTSQDRKVRARKSSIGKTGIWVSDSESEYEPPENVQDFQRNFGGDGGQDAIPQQDDGNKDCIATDQIIREAALATASGDPVALPHSLTSKNANGEKSQFVGESSSSGGQVDGKTPEQKKKEAEQIVNHAITMVIDEYKTVD
ncbi:hypothetical protein P154DRAFT_565500 [Amniculicola lignicola CBS 123094]|uniref:Uncharacterized protein n=1 Tax=Amniculicola lignicola CBS 123094 TaxID=1392246 RepID=A0A6A5W7S5_9PLEO|nr:hypothetical protein P154DRAFT_565500 [Amniculicola lignicola CBS 123094]